MNPVWLSIECPYCHAEIGAPCRTARMGRRVDTHRLRMNAAYEANRPVNSRTGEILDIPLIDDLADVLSAMVVGWEHVIGHDLSQHSSVVRVMARYRAYKAENNAILREML